MTDETRLGQSVCPSVLRYLTNGEITSEHHCALVEGHAGCHGTRLLGVPQFEMAA